MMNKQELKQKIVETDWETFNIDELNQYEGLIREIMLIAYHEWLWNQRKKPKKALDQKHIWEGLLEFLI